LERVMSALDQKTRALRILVKRNKLDIRQKNKLAMLRVTTEPTGSFGVRPQSQACAILFLISDR
jgi:hypothetical protein